MAEKKYVDINSLTHLFTTLAENGGIIKGTDAAIASVTATVDATHSESPTCTVDVGGETGAQTLTFNFTGLQGAGGASFSGTSSQILLGDGTSQDISTFITNNIEAIRTALGLATTEHMGLVPQLPAEEPAA